MSLITLQEQVNAIQLRVDALQEIENLTVRAAADGSEYIVVNVAGLDYKMLGNVLFGNRFVAKVADYTLAVADKNSTILFRGDDLTMTIPNSLGMQIGDKIRAITYGTGFAFGGSVTTISPALTYGNGMVYDIVKTDTDEFSIVQIGAADFTVDVEHVSLAGTDSTRTYERRLIDKLNSRTAVVIDRPRKYIISGSVGYTYIREEYWHEAGAGTFGTLETQFPTTQDASNVGLINRTVLETVGDPNDLAVATSIEDSINSGGEYLTTVRRIFRRTIGGVEKTYFYLGVQEIIGGTNTDVIAADFEDITSDGTTPTGTTPTMAAEYVSLLAAADVKLSNPLGFRFNTRTPNTQDTFTIGTYALNGKAEGVIDTTGKTEFPKVQGLWLFTISGTGGTATLTIGAFDYTITFDTDEDTTVSAFVTAQAATILADTGFVVTGDGDVLVLLGSSTADVSIANLTVDLDGSISSGSKPIKYMGFTQFQADKLYDIYLRYDGFYINVEFKLREILKNLQYAWNANTILKAIHNAATIFTEGFTTTINPNTQTYQDNFEGFLDNSGGAADASIVCTAAAGWTYSVNGAAAVASGTFTIDAKGLCYIARKLGTNLIKINIATATDTVYDDTDVLKDADTVSPVTGVNKLITQADVTGGGDMSKSTYDITNNGIVDDSEKVNGLTVQTAVPLGAVFTDTDTVYDDTAIQAEVDLNTVKETNIAHPLVETAVPVGAVFTDTDTVYDDTAIQAEVDLNTVKETNIAHPLVETAVPVGAVFTDTDTVYDDTAIQAEVDLNTVKETNIAHPLVETAVPVGAVFTDTDTVYDDSDVLLNTADRHSHLNKVTLDKFGESVGGLPTFNGLDVDTTIAQRDVYDGLDSLDNTISLSANNGKVLKDVQDTQQTAINLKSNNVADIASTTKFPVWKVITDWAVGLFATIANLALKANIASPTFTGVVTLPTGTQGKVVKYTSAGVLGDSAIQESADGKVGIGAIPTHVLDVGGGVNSQVLYTTGYQNQMQAANGAKKFVFVPGNGTQDAHLELYNSETVLKIVLNAGVGDTYFNGGNFGIGIIPTQKLDVVGNIKLSGIHILGQYTTATEPAYVKGAQYFNTTLNKIMFGGETEWEVSAIQAEVDLKLAKASNLSDLASTATARDNLAVVPTTATGTVLQLNNIYGIYKTTSEWNATYTIGTKVATAWHYRLIDTTGQTVLPTITGATLLPGSDFKVGASFEMWLYTMNGTDCFYYFLLIS